MAASLPLLAIAIFILTLSPSISTATDNFTDFEISSFTSSSPLIFQGDASISSTKTLQLTKINSSTGSPLPNSVGRVLYSSPVHLWDNSSGYTQISSFETTFKVVFTSTTRQIIGSGLTFFFSPVNSTIPDDSDGGFLGLFQNNTVGSSVEDVDSDYQILAVELDTYIDGKWDPNYRHIGIDVNTVRSRATIPWTRTNATELTVSIEYNANNKVLYVSASYPDGDEYEVSASIDLVAILPRYVSVGLSASTGDANVEIHTINYWSFSAWLHNVSSLTLPTHHHHNKNHNKYDGSLHYSA